MLPSPQEFQLPPRLLTLLAKASIVTGILGWGAAVPTYLVFVSVVQERALVINKNYWDGEFSHIWDQKMRESMWNHVVDSGRLRLAERGRPLLPKFWGHPLLPVGSDPGNFSSQWKDVQKICVGSCWSTLVIQWWQKQNVSSIIRALIGSLSRNSVVKWDFGNAQIWNPSLCAMMLFKIKQGVCLK